MFDILRPWTVISDYSGRNIIKAIKSHINDPRFYRFDNRFKTPICLPQKQEGK